MAIYPLCAECKALGITKATDEIDHVVPLSMGGPDTDDNCQGLCFNHHAAKSALEDTSHQAASNHPEWLKPSAIPLTILSGPPCSGKTTYVQGHAKPGDTIIDLDGILQKISPGYQHWSGMLNAELLNKGIRARNAMLGQLSRQTTGRAWFIVSAPTKAERDWWHTKLGGELVVLMPVIDELKRRALDRGTPDAVDGIDRWVEASRLSWAPAKARPKRIAADADGWPTHYM